MRTSSIDSTIPEEIMRLNLPAIEDVIVVGGGVMELYGIRRAHDIDLVVSLENWRYLRDLPNWELSYKKDFRRYLRDKTGRFDVWRWWFNPNDRSRTKLPELKAMSVQHSTGFFHLSPEAQLVFKRQLHRVKDSRDINALEELIHPSS